MPCPEKVNVPATLRFETFYSVYGLKNWAKKLYGGLEVKADKCTGCGECEPKCPYNLPVTKLLKEAHKKLVELSFFGTGKLMVAVGAPHSGENRLKLKQS